MYKHCIIFDWIIECVYVFCVCQVFEDGSLYISDLGLHHMGNYSCQDRYTDSVQQVHILHIQSKSTISDLTMAENKVKPLNSMTCSCLRIGELLNWLILDNYESLDINEKSENNVGMFNRENIHGFLDAMHWKFS